MARRRAQAKSRPGPSGRPPAQPSRRSRAPAAAAPPQAPRRRRRRNRKGAKTMLSLSTLHQGLIPSLTHQGQAFPITGLAEYEANLTTTGRTCMIFTNTGVSGTVGIVFSWTKAGGATIMNLMSILTIPTLTAADDAGGPTSLRAMKLGVDVITNTQLLNRGGTVYTLNSDQRFLLPAPPSTMTANQWNDFFNSVIAHPHRHRLDITDFAKPRHSYCHVVDDPAYNNFDENKGTLTVDNFLAHVSIWPGGTPFDRPMSSVVYLFDTPTVAQIVTASVRGTFYSRWPLNTVAGQAQRDIPTAPAQQLNAMHSTASMHSRLQPFYDGTDYTSRLNSVAGFANAVGGTMQAIGNVARIARPLMLE